LRSRLTTDAVDVTLASSHASPTTIADTLARHRDCETPIELAIKALRDENSALKNLVVGLSAII